MSNSSIIASMNHLLADSTIYYQKLRSYHWTVKGPHFFTLHTKFEELYTAWAVTIDDIAERILTIGGAPLLSLGEIIKTSDLHEVNEEIEAEAMVADIAKSLTVILNKVNAIANEAEQAGDTGTFNLVDAIRDEQQKTLWMLNATSGK